MQRILTIDITKYIGKQVKLCGWVNSRRDHGKIIFIDLRDKSGSAQIVFSPEISKVYDLAKKLREEWVIEIIGEVVERPEGMKNPKLETGSVEIKVKELLIHSESKTLPFSIEGDGYEISEEKRLQYRYLDLRRKRLKKNLEMRQKVIGFIRGFLQERGFLEVETPILTKSTPEGARDFLVPSRIHSGAFYALPQSPQQYKQLLMVAGIEKYFQIAKCFRDEDQRADRQPEFTQLDIEMSFVNQEDILNIIEELFTKLVKKLFPEKKISKTPFPRITYKEAMEKYKSDKPDLRNPPSPRLPPSPRGFRRTGRRASKKNPAELAFCFIVDFPMFEWHPSSRSKRDSGKKGKWGAMHHPFTKPKTEDINQIKKNPSKILSFQHDFVLNGQEIAGGSIRIHKPEVLEAVFEVLGHKKKEINQKFGHLLKSFEYGVPPHGGIAPGLERFLQIVLGEKNIREVIAFPKTGDNRDPMMSVPTEVSKEQLKELHIKVEKPTKK